MLPNDRLSPTPALFSLNMHMTLRHYIIILRYKNTSGVEKELAAGAFYAHGVLRSTLDCTARSLSPIGRNPRYTSLNI